MKLVVSEFISLDGVVQAPGGPEEDTDGGFAHGGWSMPYFDEEVMGPAFDKWQSDTDALLFGRCTWEVMAGAWPDRAGDPFADRMNSIDKYVVSNTLGADDLTWNNSKLISGDDIASQVSELKSKDGGALQALGSSQLVRYLVSTDLVDEYRLMIEPIILGGGKGIFVNDGVARGLALTDLQQASTGVIIATYTRA